MVPIPVMAFMHLGPLPVLARYITGTGNNWCQYRYWHICTFVKYQYWYGKLPVLPLLGARTGIGILVLWFSISIGTVHYRYWHKMVPVPVMAYLHFYPIPVLDGTLPVLALNGARTGIGTLVLWFSISIGTVHYRCWH
jgi:hypothetical protein